MEKMVKCWEALECKEEDCPAYKSKELRCWLVSGTHCRDEIQGKFIEKMEMCLGCEPFLKNMDVDSMQETLKVLQGQFSSFKEMVEERDRELESTSMEMALCLSEVFEALRKISSGDPLVRVSETSKLELITKLKHIVNLTAENLGEIVDLSHEFAIGLAEHFDVLHRVSTGDLSARVSGTSPVELLESLKKVLNEMIESVSQEIDKRQLTEEALQGAHDQLEIRVEQRTAELMKANVLLEQEIAERRQVEDALRTSEATLNSIFRVAPIGIGLVSNRILGWTNEQLSVMTGYSSDELSGKNARILYPSDEEFEWVGDEKYRQIKGLGTGTVETRWKHKDGRVIDVLLSSTPIDAEDHSKGVTFTALDITERKRAERALRKSEEEYKELVDSSLTGIFIHQDQKYVFVNDTFAEMHGYRPEELVAKEPSSLIHPDERDDLTEIGSKRLRGEDVPEQYEVRRLRKDGETIWGEMMATVIEYEGRPAIMGNMIDITVRKQAERALRESEKRFKSFLDDLSDIVYETDDLGNLTYANRAAEITAGIPRQDAIGGPFFPLFTRESQKVAIDVYQRTLKGESPEYELTFNNGRICHFKNQPRRGKNGKIMGVFGTARDITDRKVAEQRLSIYHERLRTMASKLSLAEERERRRIATEVHDHIGQNLAFARIKLGTLSEGDPSVDVKTTVAEISSLVDETIQDTRSLVSELGSPVLYELGFVPAMEWLAQQTGKRHHIAVDFDDDGQHKPLSNDVGVLMFRVVRELLANVIRHAQADRAKVSLRKNGDQIKVEVSDDGIGFNPVAIGPSEDQGGRFGLFSIRERLEPLGGHMEVVSQPGHGTQVTLSGPLESLEQNDTVNES
jgi:PAS domain S-box-containing protein